MSIAAATRLCSPAWQISGSGVASSASRGRRRISVSRPFTRIQRPSGLACPMPTGA